MMTDPASLLKFRSARSWFLTGLAGMIGLLTIGAFVALAKFTPVPELPRPISDLQAVGIGDRWQLIGKRTDPAGHPSNETWWLEVIQEDRQTESESEIKPFSSVVAFEDKLWFFNAGMYRIYDGKEWQRFDAPWVGEDPMVTALPGQLWLLSRIGDGLSLISYSGGVWDRPRPVPMNPQGRELICAERCPSDILALQGKIYYFWLKEGNLRMTVIDGVNPGEVASLGKASSLAVLAEPDRILLWYLVPIDTGAERRSSGLHSIGLKIYEADGWHDGETVSRSGPTGRLEIAAVNFQGESHLLINRGFQIEDQVWKQGKVASSRFLVGGDLARHFLRYRERILGQLVLTMTIGVGVLSLVLSRWKKSVAESGAAYASIWRRLSAKAIDTSLVLIPAGLLIGAGLDTDDPSEITLPGSLLSAGGLAFVILWAYHALSEGLWGRTLGKRLCGIAVMDDAFKPCSMRQSIIRNLLRPIDLLAFYWVGLVAISATRRWQRLGDLVARTVVVQTKT